MVVNGVDHVDKIDWCVKNINNTSLSSYFYEIDENKCRLNKSNYHSFKYHIFILIMFENIYNDFQNIYTC